MNIPHNEPVYQNVRGIVEVLIAWSPKFAGAGQDTHIRINDVCQFAKGEHAKKNCSFLSPSIRVNFDIKMPI